VHEPLQPPDAAAPAAAYALARLVTGEPRWLHTSGIVATRPDGSVPEPLPEQAEVIWATLGALLRDAGMGPSDVVSITTYVVVGEDLGVVMAARDRFFAGHRPASTLVTVPALARPEWRMEIAMVAAT
jgi:enamine deaminase RidA (YjgF/YER057c/UK114 family)